MVKADRVAKDGGSGLGRAGWLLLFQQRRAVMYLCSRELWRQKDR